MQKRIKVWLGILMAGVLCLSQGWGDRSSTGQEAGQGSFAAAEQENVLYLVYSGGICRHVLGGLVMEQLWDGTPDREKRIEFLQSARRIYEAETTGFREEELEDLREDGREGRQPGDAGEDMVSGTASTNALNAAMETQKSGADGTVDKIQKKAAICLSGRGRNDGFRNSIVSMGNMPF